MLYSVSIFQSINQSISQNLYSASSRSLFRSAPDPGQAKVDSLEKFKERRGDNTLEATYLHRKPIPITMSFAARSLRFSITLTAQELKNFTETQSIKKSDTRVAAVLLG